MELVPVSRTYFLSYAYRVKMVKITLKSLNHEGAHGEPGFHLIHLIAW